MTLSQSFVVFTPDIWSPRINMFFQEKLTAGNWFENRSSEVADGGNVLYISSMADAFAATDVKTTSGANTLTNISDTKTYLSLSNWKSAGYPISDYQAAYMSKSYGSQERYAQTLAYTLAKQLDGDLIALAHSFYSAVGDSTTLLATTLEKAIGILESFSVPTQECAFFFDPKVYWSEIMTNSKLYDASQYGKAILPYGAASKLYGIPVFLTNLLDTALYADAALCGVGNTKVNFLAHPSSICYAKGTLPGGGQGAIRYQVKEYSPPNLAVAPIADITYGVLCLNSRRGIKILSDLL